MLMSSYCDSSGIFSVHIVLLELRKRLVSRNRSTRGWREALWPRIDKLGWFLAVSAPKPIVAVAVGCGDTPGAQCWWWESTSSLEKMEKNPSLALSSNGFPVGSCG